MPTSAPIPDWVPGDIAYIAVGEYSGTLARIWEIRTAEQTAVVSLCVFRERVPFEIELAWLQKPSSSDRLRPFLFVTVTALVGPIILTVYLVMIDYFQDLRLTRILSEDILELVMSFPLAISGLAAFYVGFRELTDQESPPPG